ncbi:MAG TPA: serine/threonine-protein kinase [Micromonosporaceae bacterium]|nr:serine/threonine-protein kinase [Micromonosporaceae bacterium]
MMFAPGLRLADRYQLVARIGVGGMSEVWRATDELLSRPVAVKVLASPLAADPALRAGTRREAQAAARLTHPHVTHVYDYGEVPVAGGTPVPYLVMELVDGQSLAQRLSQGPLPWREAVLVSAQVASGLTAAHRMGVVHRDIKPGNVMLTTNGAKILDFGIAALAGAQPETDSGWLIGTPAYAAPERLQSNSADPAGDVYALGVLLFACLTGRTPIPARSWEEIADAHRRGVRAAAPQAPGLPPKVAALCRACLAPDPAERPTADEVADRLMAVLGGPGAAPTNADGIGAAPAAAFPPTLIDRSLAPPQPAPGPSGKPRGVAAAPVPHRGFPHVDGPEETGRAERGGRSQRSRLTAIAVTAAVVALGITLALIATANRPGSAPSGAATPQQAAPPTTGTSSAPATTTPPPARPKPPTSGQIINEFDQILTDLVASGQMSPKVAADLRDKLDDVRKELDGRKLPKKVDDLAKKIRKHLKDGEISQETAERLQSALQSLIAGAGGDLGDDDDD